VHSKLIVTKEDIITFWFEEISPEQWFKKDKEFDAMLLERAGTTVIKALNGQLDRWSKTSTGSVSLVILLDQFTRNIFRDTPKAFSGDEMALVLCQKSINSKWFSELSMTFKQFLLMPMMHSEDISIQEKSLPLFKQHANNRTYEFAVKHRDIIAKFGRFPHRNLILSRPSTEEELMFLNEPGSSF
tara:strand:- start:1744 stop:2301 length:558 start_codon:yes stop_codon:yes gene_type:complete